MKILQPPGWSRPKGYANGIAARGTVVFVAGQVGWDESQTFRSDDLVEQLERALGNTLTILGEAGAGPEHVARMTWYVVSCEEYLDRVREIGAAWHRRMGSHYPAMSVVQVAALLESRARVEIETTAIVPDIHGRNRRDCEGARMTKHQESESP